MSSVVFNLLAKDNATKVFGKVADGAEKSSGRIKGSFGSLAKGLTAAVAGFAAVSVFKGFVEEAEESRRIGRLTEAVIKSTGAAAKISAGQVGELATAISNKTGVDDEAIQSGANLLLTFTKVRNETGKGNDIFNQATKAAVDMSVALGTDVKGASLQLGKALNDPIKGVSALGRAGVSFTKQQKEQIKTLVESGDVLGAQKIILSEMSTQFGGAAAAAATPSQKLAVIFGNLKEQIGTALLPIVDKLATFLGEKLIPGIGRLAGWFSRLTIGGQKVKYVFTAFWAALREGDVTSNGLVGQAEKLGDALHRLGRFIMSTVVPAFRTAGTYIASNFVPAVLKVQTFIMGKVVPAVRVLAGFLISTFTPTFRQLSAFITGTVVPNFTRLAQKVRENIGPVMQVVGAIAYMGAKIAGFLMPILLKLIGYLAGTFFSILIKAVGIIGGVARAIIGITTAAINAGKDIANFATNAYNTFKALPGKIGSALAGIKEKIMAPFKTAFNAIIATYNATVGKIPGMGGPITSVGVGITNSRAPAPSVSIAPSSSPSRTGGLAGANLRTSQPQFVFTGPVYGADADELARTVAASMRRIQRTGGSGPIPTY